MSEIINSEAVVKTYNCEFKTDSWEVEGIIAEDFYICQVTDAEIDTPGTILEAKFFDGVHKEGKTNEDVKMLQFVELGIKYFPRGLDKIFPNLVGIDIDKCQLMEISNNDFEGLRHLEYLFLYKNKLTSLPTDLFVNMSKLKAVDFSDNFIDVMSSRILKPVQNNSPFWISFSANKNISHSYWPQSDDNVDSIEALMKIIDEKCTKPFYSSISGCYQYK